LPFESKHKTAEALAIEKFAGRRHYCLIQEMTHWYGNAVRTGIVLDYNTIETLDKKKLDN
jgi:hypothetical protein